MAKSVAFKPKKTKKPNRTGQTSEGNIAKRGK